MQTWLTQAQDPEHLAARLAVVLRRRNPAADGLRVIDRRPAPYASSAPSEIVTCRLRDGQVLTLYCKYSARHGHEDYGHRGGRAYEAAVYRDLLGKLPVSTATFYGAHTEEATGETLLVLEYVDPCTRVSKDPAAMINAARWIAIFHAASGTALSRTSPLGMHAYTADYYLGWVRRTLVLTRPSHRRLPWLKVVCERSLKALASLLDCTQTVIHGEYYPHNILVRDCAIYPIDWESAAVAAGVIDLASLTEQWPPEIVQACEREYQRARWAEGAPAGFPRNLDAARMYQHFRWLGDRPEWTEDERHRWRFEALRSSAERLALL